MKQCNKCNNNAFSHGYCKFHQYLRTDDKWISSQRRKEEKTRNPIKRTLIKRIFKRKVTGEAELFKSIWNSEKHVSYLTGNPLDNVPKKYFHRMFHHVMGKGRYPQFRLCRWNIILLTPQEHTDIHSLSKEQLMLKYPNYMSYHNYRQICLSNISQLNKEES